MDGGNARFEFPSKAFNTAPGSRQRGNLLPESPKGTGSSFSAWKTLSFTNGKVSIKPGKLQIIAPRWQCGPKTHPRQSACLACVSGLLIGINAQGAVDSDVVAGQYGGQRLPGNIVAAGQQMCHPRRRATFHHAFFMT